MPDIKYEIKEKLGVLSEGSKGWTKELNLISWNDQIQSMTSESGLQTMQRWVRASLCQKRS